MQLPHTREKEEEAPSLVRCSQHMCPIRVHWHVKQSYRQYWRVKITITNMNFVKNYSDWNLVVLHPNLQSVTQVFSFNYHSFNQYGNISKSNKIPIIYFQNHINFDHFVEIVVVSRFLVSTIRKFYVNVNTHITFIDKQYYILV